MRFWLLLLAISAMAQNDWREGELNGRRIRYQVIQGEAIWQGDIVLGPAATLAPATEKEANRQSAVYSFADGRWPNGVIPFTIMAGLPEPGRVAAAVEHWNTRTPFRLVPRTNEPNYVEFRRRSEGACSSSVGMLTGRQFINVPDDCGMIALVHEIGHTVGLFHTQSREDRDIYIQLREKSIGRANLSQFEQVNDGADDIGAYPYDSVMHYSNGSLAFPGQLSMETVPTGIPMGQRDGLSPSDIDTATRLYGNQPATTVVTSNPPGLEIIVDGQRVRTPVEFSWPEGSTHSLAVEDQTVDTSEYRFGRWSDFGDRSHSITASPAVTVYTVNMRRMFAFVTGASPSGGGRVSVQPAAEAGRLAEGTMVRLTGEPNEGFAFTNWTGVGFFSAHGSANPIDFGLIAPQITYTAGFSRAVLTTITSNPPGLRVLVDGTAFTTPRRVTWTAGSTHEVAIDTPMQATRGGAARHVFRGWSDGGATRHNVTASAEGGTFTADFDSSFSVAGTASPMAGGTIRVSPAPVEGFVPAGTMLTLIAAPASGFVFQGWSDSISGFEQQITVPVTEDLFVRAQFARPMTLTDAGVLNGASFSRAPIAPGEILTLFGANIGPPELTGLSLTPQQRVATVAGGTRVFFDGIESPVIYASDRQVAVVVPFAIAGRGQVRVQLEYQGRRTNELVVPAAPVAPGFFTANSSGRGGGAFLNEDGSVNTAGNPAERGSIVVLYATGLGVMQPAMADGELASAPFPIPATPFKVKIADRECEVLFGASAPGFVAGLVQLNVRVPSDIGPGIVPVFLEAAGITSARGVSLAVR